jgi:hypothetical protein
MKAVVKRKPRAVKRKPEIKPQTVALAVGPVSEKPWLLTSDEVTLIKNNVAKGASDEELKFLLTVARRYRLDPFKQQIWFVRRWDRSADNGQGGKGAHVWTPQVGINGLLFAAGRDHKQDLGSVSVPEYGPMLKVGTVLAPEWARVKVYKKGESIPTEAEAWWTEYAPAELYRAPFWKRMPRRMLAKCATALAIRQAYPDLGGLYIPEEMDRMAEDVTPSGRQIVQDGGSVAAAEQVAQRKIEAHKEGKVIDVAPEPEPEVVTIALAEFMEGVLSVTGTEGLAILKAEIETETLKELGFRKDGEHLTIPAKNAFKLEDLCKRAKVVPHWIQTSPEQSPAPANGGAAEGAKTPEAAPSKRKRTTKKAPEAEQGSLL